MICGWLLAAFAIERFHISLTRMDLESISRLSCPLRLVLYVLLVHVLPTALHLLNVQCEGIILFLRTCMKNAILHDSVRSTRCKQSIQMLCPTPQTFGPGLWNKIRQIRSLRAKLVHRLSRTGPSKRHFCSKFCPLTGSDAIKTLQTAVLPSLVPSAASCFSQSLVRPKTGRLHPCLAGCSIRR